MVSRRNIRRKVCGNKIKHLSFSNAKKTVQKMRDAHKLRVYDCPFCGGYHIGHRTGVNKRNGNARKGWFASLFFMLF